VATFAKIATTPEALTPARTPVAEVGLRLLEQGEISRIEREERYLVDYELLAIAKALRIKSSSLVD
jgi:hypothetical protein